MIWSFLRCCNSVASSVASSLRSERPSRFRRSRIGTTESRRRIIPQTQGGAPAMGSGSLSSVISTTVSIGTA